MFFRTFVQYDIKYANRYYFNYSNLTDFIYEMPI